MLCSVYRVTRLARHRFCLFLLLNRLEMKRVQKKHGYENGNESGRGSGVGAAAFKYFGYRTETARVFSFQKRFFFVYFFFFLLSPITDFTFFEHDPTAKTAKKKKKSVDH